MTNGIIDDATKAAAAQHVRGATIAWGGDRYFDFADPDASCMTIEDYAYALAYTVRWRGQAQTFRRSWLRRLLGQPGRWQRVFYGVGEHVVRGTRHMIADGHCRADCLAFLMHESDEVPFGDVPGPVKPLMPDGIQVVKRAGAAVDRRFGVVTPNPSLVKQYDIRMLVTERRDLLPGHDRDVWHAGAGGGTMSAEGYEPFERRIVPFRHPDEAAEQFLDLHFMLGGQR